jgi:ferredoxin
VGPKLQPQLALGINRPGEHHQPAGLAIEAMNGPQTPQGTFLPRRRLLPRLTGGTPPPSPLSTVDDPRQDFIQRRLQLFAAAGPAALFGVPQSGHSRRLFNHHQVLVEIADLYVVFSGGRGGRKGQQADHLPFFQAAAFVETQIAVDLNVTAGEQLPHSPPRLPRLPGPQNGENGFTSVFRSHMQNLGGGSRHTFLLTPRRALVSNAGNRGRLTLSFRVDCSHCFLPLVPAMPTINFVKEKRKVECAPGENLRQVALREGVEIYPFPHNYVNCMGMGSCASCRVHITKGTENISKQGFLEWIRLMLGPLTFFARIGHENDLRLACKVKVNGNVDVETQPPLISTGERFWG